MLDNNGAGANTLGDPPNTVDATIEASDPATNYGSLATLQVDNSALTRFLIK